MMRSNRGVSAATRMIEMFNIAWVAGLVVGLCGGLARADEPAPPSTVTVEYQADDATANLQAALDSGASVVRIPYVGQHWITRPLAMRDKTMLVLDPGVVLMAKKGEYKDPHDAVITAERVKEVAIIGGPGSRIEMHKADYLNEEEYPVGEWRHCICLKGVERAQVKGLTLASSGGDGLYVGPTWDDDRIPCKSITATHNEYVNNTRQGLSVIAAVNSYFGQSRVTGTSGRAPQAGVDIEPGSPRDPIGVTLEDWHIHDNQGSGLLVVLDRTDPESTINVLARRFCIQGTRQAAIRMKSDADRSADGRVVISDFVIERIQHEGLKVEQWNIGTNFDVKLEYVRMADVGRNVDFPVTFSFMGESQGEGAMLISDSILYDLVRREKIGAATVGETIAPLTGRLDVVTLSSRSAALPWARDFALSYR